MGDRAGDHRWGSWRKQGGKASGGSASHSSPPSQAPPQAGGQPGRQQHLEGGGGESGGSSVSQRRGEPGKSGKLSEAPWPSVCLVLWASGSLGGRLRGPSAQLPPGGWGSPGNSRDTLVGEGEPR